MINTLAYCMLDLSDHRLVNMVAGKCGLDPRKISKNENRIVCFPAHRVFQLLGDTEIEVIACACYLYFKFYGFGGSVSHTIGELLLTSLYNDLFRSIPVKPGNSTLSQGGQQIT